jgi:hypothetical protein
VISFAIVPHLAIKIPRYILKNRRQNPYPYSEVLLYLLPLRSSLGGSSLRPKIFTMAITSNMFLYSLTIQQPTAITQAIVGQFSGTKEQQIIMVSGSCLTILRPDPNLGKVTALVSHDIFGIIRSIASFRIAGSTKGKCLLSTNLSELYTNPKIGGICNSISVRRQEYNANI